MNHIECFQAWKNFSSLDDYLRDELITIDGNEEEIKDRFYKSLEFGTAGLRGVIGAGTNRMNVLTVRQATGGLAQYIKNNNKEAEGVVIAYDSRHFSPEFALESAKVLCTNGIKTYLFESLRPTPELSFAVRHLKCFSGIVITASHNPAKYNGYKVYGEDGAQISPEDAKIITKEIQKIDLLSNDRLMTEKEALDLGLLTYIGDDVDKEYLNNVFSCRVNPNVINEVSDSLSVVYTPFHGSANKPVQKILSMAGLKNLIVVKEQEMPDGDFPTVKSPNPEDKEGFTLAIDIARKNNTDLIIGTDPDGDRVGIVVRNNVGEYVAFTGNQVGALLTDYILSQHSEKGTMPHHPVVIKTVVTTEMVRPIAKHYSAEVMEVLTGFKFIGEKIKEFEKTALNSYVFGFEESYGYLSGTYTRDKDSVVASMLIVEMAAFYKKKSMTLYDALTSLYEKYGAYLEKTVNIYEEGVDGPKKISAIINSLRNNCPSEIAGLKITAMRDYESGIIKYTNGKTSPTNQPKNNMLYLELEDSKGWIAIRPSGTEPKLKLYFGFSDENMEYATEKLNELSKATLTKIKVV